MSLRSWALSLACSALCWAGSSSARGQEFAAPSFESPSVSGAASSLAPTELSVEQAAAFQDPGAMGGAPPSFVRYESSVNRGIFLGVGGSFNSIKLEQDFASEGVSQVFGNGVLVAVGAAGGPSPPITNTLTTFAPTVQIGHYRTTDSGNWLWGSKFNYKYLGTSFTESRIVPPQSGGFTTVSGTDTFTGNVVLSSATTEINHQLSFVPYLGHSFRSGYIYAGAGPTVFDVQSNIYNAYGFADINGVHYNITGSGSNYSSSEWMWGGLMQLGMIYRLNDAWFFDVSYDFAVTARNRTDYAALFTSESAPGYVTDGTLYVQQVQKITAQSLSVTLNLSF